MVGTYQKYGVKFVLAMPGGLEPSVAMQMYQQLKEGDALNYFFWFESNIPHADRGSQKSFLDYLEKTPTLVCLDLDTNDFLGCVWWTDVVTGFQAHIGVCYKRQVPREKTSACTAGALDWAFETQEMRQIWATTPWSAVVKHCETFGAWRETSLPSYFPHKGKTLDLHVLRTLPMEGRFNG